MTQEIENEITGEMSREIGGVGGGEKPVTKI